MKTHYLKTWPDCFKELKCGNKTFEIRKNDRDFRRGDNLVLEEYDSTLLKYTGEKLEFTIGYIIQDSWGIEKEYCCMSLLKKTGRPGSYEN